MHCTDRRVAGTVGKTDLAKRRITLRDASAKAKFTAAPSPSRGQFVGCLPHRHRHFDCTFGRVVARDGIVEEHHDAIARELIECSLELSDERAQRAVIFAQEVEHFLRLGSSR